MSHSPFSHVDIVLPDGTLIGSSDSPDAPVIRGNPRGVAVRPQGYQEFDIRRIAKIEVPPNVYLKPEEIEQNFYLLLESQIGKPFDSAAMHAMLGDTVIKAMDWHEAEAWFCSEYLIWSLHNARFFPYELVVPKNRVSPADSLLIMNPYMINLQEFWERIPGIVLGQREKLVFQRDSA